jgi:5,10-methylenetetrahydromethanopterin reductase
VTRKEVSVAFQTNKTAEEYISLAILVDQYPFDVVSVYCDAPYHPSYGPLTLMAPYIKTARVGPAAVSPFRIHPIDIAANTALLAELAKGGVYVGLARGAWLSEHGITEPPSPISGVREAIEIVRNLLSGESGGINGKVFHISEHVRAPYPLPNDKIPILVGTWGSKLAKVAGELADEVKIGGSCNPLIANHLQSQIALGERIAGRKLGSVKIVMGAVTVVDMDRQLARKISRRQAALYIPVVASLDPTIQVEPELIDRIQGLVNIGDFNKAGAMISDDLLDHFAFSGNPNDIIEQAYALYEVGVSRVEFGTPHGIDSKSGIDLLGRHVIPEIRKYDFR